MLFLMFSSYLRSSPEKPAHLSFQLNHDIQLPPGSDQVRRDIALRMWNFDVEHTPLPYTPLCLKAYFRYQTQQADLFKPDTGQNVIFNTHLDIVKISEILKDNVDRAEVRARMRSPDFGDHGHVQDKALDASINLAIRLLLMVEVGKVPNGFSGNSPLQWDQQTLNQLLAAHFAPCATAKEKSIRLGKVFTARNIERMAGIRIRWTNNLADHLRLSDSENDELVVNIFHHASFLIMQQEK
jgi:hypothetical protein